MEQLPVSLELEQFNKLFEMFRENYEKCSGLISNGIEKETSDCEMVIFMDCVVSIIT